LTDFDGRNCGKVVFGGFGPARQLKTQLHIKIFATRRKKMYVFHRLREGAVDFGGERATDLDMELVTI